MKIIPLKLPRREGLDDEPAYGEERGPVTAWLLVAGGHEGLNCSGNRVVPGQWHVAPFVLPIPSESSLRPQRLEKCGFTRRQWGSRGQSPACPRGQRDPIGGHHCVRRAQKARTQVAPHHLQSTALSRRRPPGIRAPGGCSKVLCHTPLAHHRVEFRYRYRYRQNKLKKTRKC